MENVAGNTAPRDVTSPEDLVNPETMRREAMYQTSMSFFRKWLSDGLITKEEYAIIDTKMNEKYRPIIGTLLSDPSLI